MSVMLRKEGVDYREMAVVYAGKRVFIQHEDGVDPGVGVDSGCIIHILGVDAHQSYLYS